MKKYIVVVEDENWQVLHLEIIAKNEKDLEAKLTKMKCELSHIEDVMQIAK